MSPYSRQNYTASGHTCSQREFHLAVHPPESNARKIYVIAYLCPLYNKAVQIAYPDKQKNRKTTWASKRTYNRKFYIDSIEYAQSK